MATEPNVFAGDPVPPTPGTAGAANEPVVAFCQQCGRALTDGTRRQIGNGTYCDPCATMRTTPAGGWLPVAGGAAYQGAAGVPRAAGEPNPKLAATLGLIPGVGAMYNGQYAKGAAHLIVFVILLSLADSLNDVFYWLVWGWVFYQAFEAYHTAVARRDGQPLPDPFGWNDLGDRIGLNRTSPPISRPPASRQPTPPPPSGFAAAEGMASPADPASPPPAQAAVPEPNPYSSFAHTPVYGSAPIQPLVDPVVHEPGFSPAAHPSTQVPFAPAFTGVEPPLPENSVASTGRRFPLGALWLIGLGAVFLVGNIAPNLRLSGRWVVPFLLAAAALWAGTTRVVSWRERAQRAGARGSFAELSSLLLFPALLLTFAVLFALQVAGSAHLTHTWPLLLIVSGALLLLGRTSDSAASLSSAGDTSTSRSNEL